MNTQAVQNIEDIRKQFSNEWLLIEVVDEDENMSKPLTGRLIAHSPHRDKIYKIAFEHEGDLMIEYSEEWPEDLVAIL